MKWNRRYYDTTYGYCEYACGEYTIRRTQDRNIFTSKPMGAANQQWQIFKNGTKIGWEFTLREAKERVEKMGNELLEWGSSVSGGYYAVYADEEKNVCRVYDETYNGIRRKISLLGMKADKNLRWEKGHSSYRVR